MPTTNRARTRAGWSTEPSASQNPTPRLGALTAGRCQRARQLVHPFRLEERLRNPSACARRAQPRRRSGRRWGRSAARAERRRRRRSRARPWRVHRLLFGLDKGEGNQLSRSSTLHGDVDLVALVDPVHQDRGVRCGRNPDLEHRQRAESLAAKRQVLSTFIGHSSALSTFQPARSS